MIVHLTIIEGDAHRLRAGCDLDVNSTHLFLHIGISFHASKERENYGRSHFTDARTSLTVSVGTLLRHSGNQSIQHRLLASNVVLMLLREEQLSSRQEGEEQLCLCVCTAAAGVFLFSSNRQEAFQT